MFSQEGGIQEDKSPEGGMQEEKYEQFDFDKEISEIDYCKYNHINTAAYLLLLGADSCHDGDEYFGIYTDISSLKKAYDIMVYENIDSYLKPIIYEFSIMNAEKQNYKEINGSELFNRN